MKVYVVNFCYEHDQNTEGVFLTRQDARNYIYNEALERGLYEDEIWIEETELRTCKR